MLQVLGRVVPGDFTMAALYRLVPTENGIMLEVPWEFESLVQVLQPDHLVVRRFDVPFLAEAQRWGYLSSIGREDRGDVVNYMVDFDEKLACAQTRSLNLMTLAFAQLDYVEERRPLVEITDFLSQNGFSGHGFQAVLSRTAEGRLSRFTEEDRLVVATAMKETAHRLGEERTFPFYCTTGHGRVCLGVPGEETYLVMSARLMECGGHNIDTVVQQFSILKGVAHVHAILERY